MKIYGEIIRHLGKFGIKLYYNFDNLKKFYKNKNVLITGHTGFKGSWLVEFLNHLNANILGISNYKIKTVINIKKINRIDLEKKIKVWAF